MEGRVNGRPEEREKMFADLPIPRSQDPPERFMHRSTYGLLMEPLARKLRYVSAEARRLHSLRARWVTKF